MRHFSPARLISSALLLSSASAFSQAALAADFGWEAVADLAGTTSRSTAISADGSVIVGIITTPDPMGDPNGAVTSGFSWSAEDGTSALGAPIGWASMYVAGINADGTMYVGNLFGGNPTEAFRASITTGDIDLLGFLPGGTVSRATAISGDGNTVAGWGNSTNGVRAFRWTYDPVALSGSMQELGTLGGSSSIGNGISRDGHVIVGHADTAAGVSTAAYWVDAGPATAIGILPGGGSSAAHAANADGSVIVGGSEAGGVYRAFLWAASTNVMVNLGSLGGGESTAYGVSDDGTVVVGQAGQGLGVYNGFRWTEATGMISVDEWLRQSGVTLTTDVTNDATAVSADGTIIVGTLRDGKAYVARGASTDPNGPGAGIIAVEDYMQSFNGLPRHVLVPQQIADLAMNGANSSPMFHRLSAGQHALWATGDIGAVKNDFGTGPTGTGEIGFAYAPTDDLTLRLGIGTSYSKADLDLDGYSRVSGSYILPEATMAIAPDVYATLTGYASFGNQSMRRAYQNGLGNDASEGESDTRTLGFRARLDWLNAFQVQDTAFSPYASFTHLTTRVDGYSETGGGFPASFDEVKGSSNTLRLGLDGRYDLTSTIALIGRAEVAHRFEDQAPDTSGEIIGFSSFDLPGAPIEQNWLRGGIGFEAKSGTLESQVMFNASSQEEGSYWLSASTRVIF
ncbi:autotransporter domain-containing protein [Rhizobium glycinendophyticum]|uniref:Autotransporter domain-containing protein n=1 Tax=Rhizobium glycinendophyticum TaxID=2589807 RepID=A0A504UM50_9HYPH|nr:autotransporter domain-containing protein [Rhizobium glycinendophyticum]TPP10176.1 autotransporter domain-containing protein [Rhizobium glycinendophyticum]